MKAPSTLPGMQVSPGDQFLAVGESPYGELTHRLACADLETLRGEAPPLLREVPHVRLINSDPPWSSGNCKFWRTFAKMPKAVEYRSFLRAYLALIAPFEPLHMVVAQSVHEGNVLVEMVQEVFGGKYRHKGDWIATYNAGKKRLPLKIVGFARWDVSLSKDFDPSGRHGKDVIDLTFRAFGAPGEYVFDPCTGTGATVRFAHKYGMHALGTELNPVRLGKTLSWLLRHGYAVQRLAG